MNEEKTIPIVSARIHKNCNFFYPGLLVITCFLLIEHVVIINTLMTKNYQNERKLSAIQPELPTIFNQEAFPLPSLRVQVNDNTTSLRGNYGGDGDGSHLGGFLELDCNSLSPNVWKLMMEKIGIKSVVDVGCGRGISTSFFLHQGIESTCIEGSHDAVTKSVLPSSNIIEHDYSRGPYWTKNTVDAIWCVEFLERVSRKYHRNLFPTFKKAALVFASHSNWVSLPSDHLSSCFKIKIMFTGRMASR